MLASILEPGKVFAWTSRFLRGRLRSRRATLDENIMMAETSAISAELHGCLRSLLDFNRVRLGFLTKFDKLFSGFQRSCAILKWILTDCQGIVRNSMLFHRFWGSLSISGESWWFFLCGCYSEGIVSGIQSGGRTIRGQSTPRPDEKEQNLRKPL